MGEPDYFEVLNFEEFNGKYIHYYSREFLFKTMEARKNGVPLKVLFTEFEEILEKERNRKFEKEYQENIAEAYQKAKELENIDNEKAIGFYEAIRDRHHHFDVLGRLIILYRKTKQPDKEVEAIKFLIEEEEIKAFERMELMQIKYPDYRDEIRFCYDNDLPFTNPEFGFDVNFRKKVIRLQDRLQKLENKQKLL